MLNFYDAEPGRVEIWLDGTLGDLDRDDEDLACELLGELPEAEAEAYWEQLNA